MDVRRLNADGLARHIARAGLTECRSDALPAMAPAVSWRCRWHTVGAVRCEEALPANTMAYWPRCFTAPASIFGVCEVAS